MSDYEWAADFVVYEQEGGVVTADSEEAAEYEATAIVKEQYPNAKQIEVYLKEVKKS